MIDAVLAVARWLNASGVEFLRDPSSPRYWRRRRSEGKCSWDVLHPTFGMVLGWWEVDTDTTKHAQKNDGTSQSNYLPSGKLT
jgi:hypothetical protein